MIGVAVAKVRRVVAGPAVQYERRAVGRDAVSGDRAVVVPEARVAQAVPEAPAVRDVVFFWK
jgi:hypothetical protein